MNTKATGDIGEQIAAEYLLSKGYNIAARNAKYADCEVDIIAYAELDKNGDPIKRRRIFKKHGEKTLIFIEVKTRYGDAYGAGAEAVTPYKVGRYIVAAKQFLLMKGLTGVPVRFDMILITDGEIEHVKAAFAEDDAKYPRHR